MPCMREIIRVCTLNSSATRIASDNPTEIHIGLSIKTVQNFMTVFSHGELNENSRYVTGGQRGEQDINYCDGR